MDADRFYHDYDISDRMYAYILFPCDVLNLMGVDRFSDDYDIFGTMRAYIYSYMMC